MWCLYDFMKSLFPGCFALECYECKDQSDNKDKCIKTTIQCEEDQDACGTTINYKSKIPTLILFSQQLVSAFNLLAHSQMIG